MGVSSARAATAAAPPPAGSAKASALRQSPATKSRLAGVGILASFKKSCNSSIELAVLVKTWAEVSSVRIRDQQASVNLTVRALTALAAARSAGMREILQRGRKALTAWNVEGHELDSSGSTRSGRRRLPVEARRRRDHLGTGGKKDRATRSRGSSGGAHNHGL